jgi:large subunit ribosomal protein LP1
MAEKEQLAVSYAAFVLAGSGAEVNENSLKAVLKAANVEVSASLVAGVAKALKGRNVTEFFGSVSAGSAPAETAKPAKEEKKDDKKKEEKTKQAPPPPPPKAEEEEGMDMGGLFD